MYIWKQSIFTERKIYPYVKLEDLRTESARNIITREMIANLLIHREFSSSYQAQFVIENHRMYAENASRAMQKGLITPENLEPNPQNPIIVVFFRNVSREGGKRYGFWKINT